MSNDSGDSALPAPLHSAFSYWQIGNLIRVTCSILNKLQGYRLGADGFKKQEVQRVLERKIWRLIYKEPYSSHKSITLKEDWFRNTNDDTNLHQQAFEIC